MDPQVNITTTEKPKLTVNNPKKTCETICQVRFVYQTKNKNKKVTLRRNIFL